MITKLPAEVATAIAEVATKDAATCLRMFLESGEHDDLADYIYHCLRAAGVEKKAAIIESERIADKAGLPK